MSLQAMGMRDTLLAQGCGSGCRRRRQGSGPILEYDGRGDTHKNKQGEGQVATIFSSLFILGGAIFLVGALVASFYEAANMRRRTPVKVRCIDLRAETGLKGASYLSPEYLVVSGPQAGLRKVSTASTFTALHNKGDIVDGFLDPETNEVRSLKENKLTTWCIVGLVGLGTAMLAVGVKYGNVPLLGLGS